MDNATQQLERHYTEIGPALLNYFRQRMTAGSADDMLQDTFLRAWHRRHELHRAVSPRAYLFGIARHVCADAHRRRRVSEPLKEDQLPAETSIPDERLELLRAAIKQLPETHREPLRLKLQHELSYVEIAEVLGVPIGTVRSRLHYAIERLQQVLNPGTNPPPL